jgi:glycosyltransferase involved in cell wall biosynthesis
MRPVILPGYITQLFGYTNEEKIARTRQQYATLLKGQPEVTVVIPAYNEEANILNPLLSISANTTSRSVEIIVVNNNCTDNTEPLALAAGVTCIRETTKGVTAARTAGLHAARGKYILNADADSIYPPTWIDAMIPPLDDNTVALTYGMFAFLPGGSKPRFSYFVYEHMADMLRWYKRNFKEEAMNVYGCNSGFRKEQCLQVDAYQHPPGTNEDGWLAVKLRNKGFGRLHKVYNNKALVWTVDRHLQNDGGLLKALVMRVKQVILPGK